MADPMSLEAPSWLTDVETTKSLLSHPSLRNNRIATRCLEVVNRLFSFPNTTSETQQLFSGQSLAASSFGMFPEVDQELSMEYSDWLNFPTSGEMV